MARKKSCPKPEVSSENETMVPASENVMDDDLETFKVSISKMDASKFARYKSAMDAEAKLRQSHEMNNVLEFVKTLSLENQELFLNSVQTTIFKRKTISEDKTGKVRKEKKPLRMYQDYPEDNPQYKIAPLVNVELREIFTGGNPQNKSWLANLQLEERYELFGTMKKLEQNSEFIYELMNIPKAVFKKEAENWIDCCKE